MDWGSVLAMGEARGVDRRLLGQLLPTLERVIVARLNMTAEDAARETDG